MLTVPGNALGCRASRLRPGHPGSDREFEVAICCLGKYGLLQDSGTNSQGQFMNILVLGGTGLLEHKPRVVVNCVGIIKQRADSKKPVPSIYINSLLPHLLSETCERTGTKLIHVSTDCVFSGKEGNYREDDLPDAEDLYGRTKSL